MTARPDLGLGDLARCLVALQPADVSTVALVASLLGLAIPTAKPEAPGKRDEPTAPEARLIDESGDGSFDAQLRQDATLITENLLPRLTPIAGQRRSLTSPWRAEPELKPFEPARHLQPPPRRPALFDERWARELLAALLVTEVPEGRLDVEVAVDRLARGQPLNPVPYIVRLSLRRGAQILVDVGEGMEPFARDAWDVALQIERLAGATNVSILSFWDAPLRGVGPEHKRYVAPLPRCPVVALSDVGIGGPSIRLERSEPGEWLALAALLRARSSPLIVLSPYREARWPPGLRQRLAFVEWDRTTTASRAHKLGSAARGRQRR
jgi:hypothetical protein